MESAPFTPTEIKAMQAILADPRPIHDSDPGSAHAHIEHCLWQTVRFAHLAETGLPFRGAQWGLNFGRAQEILKSHGGITAWWLAFEPLIESQEWAKLAAKSLSYLDILDLQHPDETFINRV
jgi:hypothetical protein